MRYEKYIKRYREIEKITSGMTMAQIREYFGNDITNDLIDEGIIDANYKELTITFVEEKGVAKLRNSFEIWSSNGGFIDFITVE